MLLGYDAAADEAVLFDGSARGPYGLIMTALDRIGCRRAARAGAVCATRSSGGWA